MIADSFSCVQSHIPLRWLIRIGILFALLAWLSTSFEIPLATADVLSVSELLNANGTLNLTKGKVGTVDVREWNVQLDPQRGPVFTPDAPTASNWSALGNGVNGVVVALAVSGAQRTASLAIRNSIANKTMPPIMKMVVNSIVGALSVVSRLVGSEQTNAANLSCGLICLASFPSSLPTAHPLRTAHCSLLTTFDSWRARQS